MVNKDTAYKKISELVERFTDQYESYKKSDYNETMTRRDFIDPFFKALGWDIDNEHGYAESYREVIHEDRVKVSGATKAPDYSFRLVGGKRLFFVEAKKPSLSVKEEIPSAYQIRRYGWSAKLPVSIITDFEEFSVYDCTKKPKPTDKASTARIKFITFQDYLKDFDFIWETFSKERVLKGSFDKFVQSDTYKKGTATVDKDFLQSLDRWRTYLATSIALNNQKLDEDEINFAVQQTIDRIIFLRIAEDRSVEPYGNLKDAIKQGDFYKNLFEQFCRADEKYNSGLFDFNKDQISKHLKIDNKVTKTIINELYYPESPYEFSVLSVEILGSAYEQFLGKVIRITPAYHAKIEEKPEVRKAGGVYYTPQYIVEYIVKNTVGKLINSPFEGGGGMSPKEISKIKIVDPACGSGSFLLGAYQYLLDYHKHYYITNSPLESVPRAGRGKRGVSKPSKEQLKFLTPDGNLTTNEKKRILLNNIFGVDIDVNAVEVTKLSLLLKCMEGETEASINHQLKMFHERILPDLENNIKCGNSLIDTDFYASQLDFGEENLSAGKAGKIKPFNWQRAFPEVFKQGGFDVVIGNPPYVRIHELENNSKDYYRKNYSSANNQFDLYQLFYEKGLTLLNENGKLGFITSNKFCITNYGKALREIIFKKSLIEQVVDCSSSNVFGNVSTYPFIFILKVKQQKNNTVELYKDYNGKIESLDKVRQDKLLKGEEEIFSFQSLSPSYKIIERLEKKCKTQFVSVYRGRGTSKDLIKTGTKKSVTNKEVLRYKPFSEILFRAKSKYQNDYEPKILMKKICYNIECNIDESGEINPINTVYVVKPINKSISIKYLIGILNSKLLSFYTRKKYETTGMRGGYIELRVFEVEKLPIIEATNNEQIETIKFVDQLLKLNEEKAEAKLQTKINQLQSKIDYCESRINEIVYQLYGLTADEIKIVEKS
ncbi:MAG: N-6 DNA methylase [Bacteroidota bacterium]|nr:N-6 DNA methylase [Bacteroidota bacterium]